MILPALILATDVVAFVALSHGDFHRFHGWEYAIPAWWLFTAGILLMMCGDPRVTPEQPDQRMASQPRAPRVRDGQLLVAAIVLVLGFLFRSAELDRLPWGYAGMHIDSAYNSELAFRILDGTQPFAAVLPSVAFARDFIPPYYLAAFFGVFGKTIETLRLASNVVGLLDCFLLFLILRGYTSSAFATIATLVAYVFSGPETVFTLSGLYDITAAPFLLGSFLLFRRAIRCGTYRAAALAGFTWGLGFSSHYSYMYLGVVLPAIAVLNLKVVRPWLGIFIVAGFLGALPKVSYLLFDHLDYFERFHAVARHDYSAGMANYLSANGRRLISLLIKPQTYDKWFLPEDPVISWWQLPLMLLGAGVALLRPWRPEHALALLVTILTAAATFAAYVVDYRLMSAMPILFLLFGIGVVTIERIARGSAGHAPLALLIGGGVIQSLAGYFSHDNPALRVFGFYGTDEVALARSIRTLPPGMVYVLAPRVTYRLEFFNPDKPGIAGLNSGIGDSTAFSERGLAMTMGNVERSLARDAAHHVPVHFVINPASPYASAVARALLNAYAATIRPLSVRNPVSQETTVYSLVSIQDPARAIGEWRQRAVASSGITPENEERLRRGTLRLTTFAGTDQVLMVDEREVPAILDFDFQTRVPYPRDWRSDFSLRWTGYLRADQTGDYRFDATFDDGCRVFLDDHPLLTDWAIGGARKATASAKLEAGWHAIRIDYFQATGEETFWFEVRREGEPTVPLSAADFASDAGTGTRAEMQRSSGVVDVPETH